VGCTDLIANLDCQDLHGGRDATPRTRSIVRHSYGRPLRLGLVSPHGTCLRGDTRAMAAPKSSNSRGSTLRKGSAIGTFRLVVCPTASPHLRLRRNTASQNGSAGCVSFRPDGSDPHNAYEAKSRKGRPKDCGTPTVLNVASSTDTTMSGICGNQKGKILARTGLELTQSVRSTAGGRSIDHSTLGDA
jgi:hypothetical protein